MWNCNFFYLYSIFHVSSSTLCGFHFIYFHKHWCFECMEFFLLLSSAAPKNYKINLFSSIFCNGFLLFFSHAYTYTYHIHKRIVSYHIIETQMDPIVQSSIEMRINSCKFFHALLLISTFSCINNWPLCKTRNLTSIVEKGHF